MTPTTSPLAQALREAATDALDRAGPAHRPAPDSAGIWARGRRITWAARAAATGLVASAVVLLTTVVVVVGEAPTTMPANGSARTYPTFVSELSPGRYEEGSTPVFGFVGAPPETTRRVYVIDRRGLLSAAPGASALHAGGVLAPDGRQLLVDDGVVDMSDGILRRFIANDHVAGARVLGSGVWAPDSAHVLIDTSRGPVVLDTFAVVSSPPGPDDAGVTPAGWRDASTILGVRERVVDGRSELDVVTRALSDIAWTTLNHLDGPFVAGRGPFMAAHASPDGSRLLLRYATADGAAGGPAVLVATGSGRAEGMAGANGPAVEGWDSCPPVWRANQPLMAARGLQHPADGAPLMEFSGRLDLGCVTLAGSELVGTPDPDSAGLLREQVWRVAVPLGGAIAVLGAVWVVLALRRSRREERPGKRWLPMIYDPRL